MAFVEPKVAHYKRIRHVAFVDAIPKSPPEKSSGESSSRKNDCRG